MNDLLENIPAVDLGMSHFKLDIEQFGALYRYRLWFELTATNRSYHTEGVSNSPSQCFDHAMFYLVEQMREAVPSG